MTDTDAMVRAVWLITQLIHPADPPPPVDWNAYAFCPICGD